MYPNRSSDSIHSQPTVLIKKSMVTRQAWNQARKSNQWAGIREKIRKVLIGCRCTSSITQVSGKGLTIKVATEQRRGGFKRADSYFFKAVLSQPSEPMDDMAVPYQWPGCGPRQQNSLGWEDALRDLMYGLLGAVAFFYQEKWWHKEKKCTGFRVHQLFCPCTISHITSSHVFLIMWLRMAKWNVSRSCRSEG